MKGKARHRITTAVEAPAPGACRSPRASSRPKLPVWLWSRARTCPGKAGTVEPPPPSPRTHGSAPVPCRWHHRGAFGPATRVAPRAAQREAGSCCSPAGLRDPVSSTDPRGMPMGGRSCLTHGLARVPAGFPGLPRSPSSAAQFTVIPCKPESHFPADGAAFLYSAQHSHRSPPRHPRCGGAQGAERFRKQSIRVLLSLERELGNPTAKTSEVLWSQHFPRSRRGRSLQGLRATLH